jgi:single-strand DNA-binding protein
MAVVSGRLQSRKWEDRDGNKRTSWEVVADNVYFGESRRDGGDSGESRSYTRDYEAPKSSPKPASSPFEDLGGDDGELPF